MISIKKQNKKNKNKQSKKAKNVKHFLQITQKKIYIKKYSKIYSKKYSKNIRKHNKINKIISGGGKIFKDEINRISGSYKLTVLQENIEDGRVLVAFSDWHDKLPECSDCTIETGCYNMEEMFKYFDTEVPQCEFYVEAFKDRNEIYKGSDMEKIRDILFTKTKLNNVDLRTPEVLDHFIKWFIIKKNENNGDAGSILQIFYNDLTENILCLPKNTLPFPLTDEIINFIGNYFQEDIIDKIYNMIDNIDTMNTMDTHKLEISSIYHSAAILIYFIIDIYTIMMIENDKVNKTLVLWMGDKHIQNILSYFRDLGWKDIIYKDANIKSKCINLQ